MLKSINLLFLFSFFNFFAFASIPPVGSPEWCAIYKVCDDPATGPDDGTDEAKNVERRKKI